jgi:hypothetical protein
MKILRRVLFAIAILSTTGFATSCFDNSEEVFKYGYNKELYNRARD